MLPRFPQTIALRARPALSALVLAAVILGAAGPATADAPGSDIDGSASSTTNRAPSFGATTTTTVTDENEPPLAPGAPGVGRVVGSLTSLAVRWTAPDNTGRPAIESYDVQYRTRTEPWWSMPPRNVTDTAATITHLLRNTTYEVQVRAKNANGDGPWSESGSGTTGKNTAPSFGATSTTRSVAENTEPGQAIGDPVTATDPEGDTLTYRLEGTDAAAFDIDEATGQLRTSAALDYETRSSYSVTVVAEDSEGANLDGSAGTLTVFGHHRHRVARPRLVVERGAGAELPIGLVDAERIRIRSPQAVGQRVALGVRGRLPGLRWPAPVRCSRPRCACCRWGRTRAARSHPHRSPKW